MSTTIYKVVFFNQDKIFEVYAQQVYQSDLYGFVVLEEFIFGGRATMVVDPAEEKLKAEFDSVRRSYIPMHAIIRIDEVKKEGVARIRDIDDNVAHFPTSVYTPGSGKSGDK